MLYCLILNWGSSVWDGMGYTCPKNSISPKSLSTRMSNICTLFLVPTMPMQFKRAKWLTCNFHSSVKSKELGQDFKKSTKSSETFLRRAEGENVALSAGCVVWPRAGHSPPSAAGASAARGQQSFRKSGEFASPLEIFISIHLYVINSEYWEKISFQLFTSAER